MAKYKHLHLQNIPPSGGQISNVHCGPGSKNAAGSSKGGSNYLILEQLSTERDPLKICYCRLRYDNGIFRQTEHLLSLTVQQRELKVRRLSYLYVPVAGRPYHSSCVHFNVGQLKHV